MTYRILLAFSILGSLCIAGCGGGGGNQNTPQVSPTITSVSIACTPASILTGQTSQCSATVSGTGAYSTAVTWSATDGTINSAGVFTPAASGTATIAATSTQDSTKSGTTSVTVAVPANPVPTVTMLSPNSLTVGAAPQSLTISGTGFLPSSTVTLNSIAHTATYVSASQLTISLTSADLSTVGSFPIVVTNPAPGGGASSPVNLTVTGNSSGSGEWTWMSGSNTGGAPGAYGSLGVPSALNVPGQRVGTVSWIDGNGNLWLFGGYGVNLTGIGGYLNDLWEFNPTAKTWTWVNGANTTNQAGVYGTQGTPASTNVPGARESAVTWVDSNGNFWLFGGHGVDSTGNDGHLNDLWEFNPTARTWTWINGANTADQTGVYGTQGGPATTNVPGARIGPVSWIDAKGNLWLLGGYGVSSTGISGYLNDLWEFNPSAKTWTWVTGANTANQTGVYGIQGAPATSNTPGARYGAVSWTDGKGNLWLFGGYGVDSTGNGDWFNDLWEFSPAAKTWIWMTGANTANQAGVFGTQGIPATTNSPGPLYGAVSWIDGGGNLWLFGGDGVDLTGNGDWFNDLWEFNPVAKTWTWVSGAKTANQAGVYGIQGIPSAANISGARESTANWIDSNGNLWLFGGDGIDSTGFAWDLNDLWRYQPSTSAVSTITSVSAACSPASILTTQTATCTPTVTGTGSYGTSVTWSVSPASIGVVGSAGIFTPASAGAATITATSTQDLTKSGSATVTVTTPAVLVVTITDLPPGTAANVTVTDPNGQQTALTSTQTISAIPGSYTIAAAPVVVGTSTYNPTLAAQAAVVTVGNTTNTVVDYKNVVPATTKVLDSLAISSLSVSPNGLTLTMSASSPVAQSLAPGDVIVVPPTSASGIAPMGMLRYVISTNNSNSQIVATTQPGTLSEAFQRVGFQIQDQLATASIQVAHLAPGVVFRPGATVAKSLGNVHAHNSSGPPSDPCGGYSLGVFDVPESIQIDAVPGLSLSGTIEVCSGLNFAVDIVGTGFLGLQPAVNSLTATASMGEYADLTLQGDLLSGSFDPNPTTLATLDFPPIAVAGLPIWVTPEISVFVGASGNIASGLSTEVSSAGTFIGGVTYASGTWSPVPLTPSFQFGYQPPTLSASLSAKAYAGIEFDLYVYDLIGPSFKPDGYLDLEANIASNPWWTLSAGLEGPMSLDVTFLGENLASYDLGTLFDYSHTILSASGPFSPSSATPVVQSIAPTQVTAGASGFNLSVLGTNFLPGATVTFGGASLGTTWQSSSQLTVGVPSSLVSTPGTFQVSVTNPGASSTPSNSEPFTVNNPNPVITPPLSPASLPAGSATQTLTINGTGFLTSSTVTFNGTAHAATFISASQLTISLTASDLATAGSYPVVVTNPAPGGGSATATFTITPTANPIPTITQLNPVSLAVGAIPQTLTISGTGYLTTSTVTFSGASDPATYLSGTQLTISLTSADLATAGTYPVVVTNPAPGGGSSGPKNFTVTNSQTAGEWTWMNGSSAVDTLGVYGTLGVPSTSNVPGSRNAASNWTDNGGNFWLFGGYGYDSTGALAQLNDLWMFDRVNGNWTWVSGSGTVGAAAVYGAQGVPSTTNVPGGRFFAISWLDKNGKLWLFGGEGVGSNNVSGFLDDLWEFDPIAKTWTWVSGNSASNTPGIYGTKGVPSTGNVPGSRYRAVSWIDSTGNLWLLGGDGVDSNGFPGQLNDLWEFNPSANTWTWISGSSTANVDGVYGTQGIPASTSVPGSRRQAVGWIDGSDNLWLFGGSGWNASGSSGGAPLNDLWRFNPTAKTWTWVSGSSTTYTNGTISAIGVYGTKGTGAAANTPGGRTNPANWIDSSGAIWLFGGNGFDSTATVGELNDLWKFNPGTSEWTWVAGSNIENAIGMYGTQGAPATTNVPGSRDYPVCWIDNIGNLWLFGGYGYNSIGNGGYLNDLWRYQP